MKNILIIGARDSGTKNDPRIIAEAIESSSVRTEVLYWEDLVIDINSGAVQFLMPSGQDVADARSDLVIAVGWYQSGKRSIYRDVAFALALYLEHHNIRFWNREMLFQRSTSKLSCMVQLALAGIPVPDTQFSLDNQTISLRALPFIAKAASASRGRSNYLVSSESERSEIDLGAGHFLVQPFLPNDHDLRIICMGGEPQLILKRSRAKGADTHLNNVSQGGEGVWLGKSTVAPELLTISTKICKILGRDLAGIDFIPDESSPFGYSCLEANAIPQLTSGQDVQIKMSALKQIISEA